MLSFHPKTWLHGLILRKLCHLLVLCVDKRESTELESGILIALLNMLVLPHIYLCIGLSPSIGSPSLSWLRSSKSNLLEIKLFSNSMRECCITFEV